MNSRLIFHKIIYYIIFGVISIGIQHHISDGFYSGWFVGACFAIFNEIIFYNITDFKSKYKSK